MEAVPRLPMISFDCKTSTENASFWAPLQQYIKDFYNEDPDSYTNEIQNIESLRSAAVRPSNDLAGCQVLKKYYCQLHFLKTRFPMEEMQPAAVYFSWKDPYSNLACSVPDIRFELMCILYNIGAMHTKLGCQDVRVTPEGMKMACTHFQCAAWAFQTIKEAYYQMVTYISSIEMVHFMQTVSLAQAQECILEKSMLDNRKATIIAKVAVQVVDYYRRALQLLHSSTEDSDFLGSKTNKEWLKYLSFKVAYHRCISLLFQGQQAEEQQKMGERVAFYQLAGEQLEEARKLSNNLTHNKQEIAEALAFTSDVVEGKKKAAKNENEFIYHENVPTKEALQEVKGHSLVKGIPFSVTDVEVSGPDFFARLVPMEAHEASSLYSEKKAQMLRQIGELVETKDQELVEFMSSLQLEVITQMRQATGISQDLVDRAAALSAKPNAIQDLIEVMGKLSNSYHEVEAMLNEIQELLKEEEKGEKEYQEIMGKRPPSIIATDLSREAAKYREAHNKANDSNQNLHKAMTTHVANLKILSQPLSQLQQQIPSVQLPDPNVDENAVREIETLLSKVEEMRTQRAMLWAQFREAVHKDDITGVLVTRQPDQPIEKLFQDELQKHQNVISLIEQNSAAQENIMKAMVEAYAKFANSRRHLQGIINKRAATVNSLISSFDSYEDLLSTAKKGIDFYIKLETNVTKLLQRIKSACKVQQEEREQMLSKTSGFKSKEPSFKSKEPATAPDSGAPKLKDYLDSRKKLSQVPNVPYAPSYGVTDGQLWPPSVRPTPLGSEVNDKTAYDSTTGQYQVLGGYHGAINEKDVDQVLSSRMSTLLGNNKQQNYTATANYGYSVGYPANYQQYSSGYGSGADSKSTLASYGGTTAGTMNEAKAYGANLSGSYMQSYPAPFSQQSSTYGTPSSEIPTTFPTNQTSQSSASYSTYQNTTAFPQGGQSVPGFTQPGSTSTGDYQSVVGGTYENITEGVYQDTTGAAYQGVGYQTGVNYQTPANFSQVGGTAQSLQNVGFPQVGGTAQSLQNAAGLSQVGSTSQTLQNSSGFSQVGATSQTLQNVAGFSQVGGTSQTLQNAASFSPVVGTARSLQSNEITSQSVGVVNYHNTALAPSPVVDGSAQGFNTYGTIPQSYAGVYFPSSQEQTYIPNQNAGSHSSLHNYTVTTVSSNKANSQNYTQSTDYAVSVSTAQLPSNFSSAYPASVSDYQNISSYQTPDYQSTSQYPSASGTYNLSNVSGDSSTNISSSAATITQQYPQYYSQYAYAQDGTPMYQGAGPLTQQTQQPSSTYTQATPPYPYNPNNTSSSTGGVSSIQNYQNPEQPISATPNYTYISNTTAENNVVKPSPTPNKSSNIDLLSGLDFSINQAPLIPQQNAKEPTNDIPKAESAAPKAEPAPKVEPSVAPQPVERVISRKSLDNAEVKKLFAQEMDKFEKFVDVLGNKTLNGPTNLDLKWKEIQEKQEGDGAKKIISVARCYPMKNRFPDILPYDYSRVELVSTKDDYINASYVKDISPYVPTFIITQAPTSSTLLDFWTMIKEQRIEFVMCLLSDSELDGDIYWPREKGKDLCVSNMVISLQSMIVKNYWTERLISITLPEKRDSTTIVHLQYTAWPGSLFPTSPEPFVMYIKECITLYQQQRLHSYPILIHCLSGIGRSGLACLLMAAVFDVTNSPTSIPDLTLLTNKISAFRKNVLRDREHLKFAYQAFLSYVKLLVQDIRRVSITKKEIGELLPHDDKTAVKKEIENDPLNSLDPFWASKK